MVKEIKESRIVNKIYSLMKTLENTHTSFRSKDVLYLGIRNGYGFDNIIIINHEKNKIDVHYNRILNRICMVGCGVIDYKDLIDCSIIKCFGLENYKLEEW